MFTYYFGSGRWTVCRQSRSDVTSDDQSVCRGVEPTVELVTRYYFLSEGCYLKVAVLSLWGALSDERSVLRSSKLLYDSQYVLVSSTLVGLATRYYFLSVCCCLKFVVLFLWGALSDERTGEVRLLYDWRSVSHYVLVSSTLVGLATRYYFLSEGCYLKVAVSSLWGALSDERSVLRCSKLLYDSQYVLVSSTLVGLATRYYFLSVCCCLKFVVLFMWGALSDERTGEVRLLYDWRSVSHYVLVSSTLVGLATRYYFLSECCCLKFAVLFLTRARVCNRIHHKARPSNRLLLLA
jgi:uncharacterized membrane protein